MNIANNCETLRLPELKFQFWQLNEGPQHFPILHSLVAYDHTKHTVKKKMWGGAPQSMRRTEMLSARAENLAARAARAKQ